MDRESLALLLAQRLLDLYGKERLSAILAEIKAQPGVERRAFRVTGTNEELKAEVPKALHAADDLPERLAAAIDLIEENGTQHIFLFKFKTSGRGSLTASHFEALPELPSVPPPSLYAGIPTSAKMYRREVASCLRVKHVRRATYEELESETRSEGRRIVSYQTIQTRAVNVMRLDFNSGEAEIRIDRARNRQDDELALNLFRTFAADLSSATGVDVMESFESIPVWTPPVFGRILDARSETHMSTDTFRDPSVSMKMSSLREEDKGKDIRDHPSWLRDAVRKAIRIYWNVPADEGDDVESDGKPRLYTVISSIDVPTRVDNEDGGPNSGHRLGKVYVPARTSPKKLEHAITRIRHFTR